MKRKHLHRTTGTANTAKQNLSLVTSSEVNKLQKGEAFNPHITFRASYIIVTKIQYLQSLSLVKVHKIAIKEKKMLKVPSYITVYNN